MATAADAAPTPLVYGPMPAHIKCPSCKNTITTQIVIHNTAMTHAFAFLLCLCGFWCCCFIPYLMKSCKAHDHYCPSCGLLLGSYKP